MKNSLCAAAIGFGVMAFYPASTAQQADAVDRLVKEFSPTTLTKEQQRKELEK